MTSNVATAAAELDWESFVAEPDGNQLPQSSAPVTIAELADLADIEPGQRVLEIGTGSGYSAALLASLTGTGGTVVSIEVDEQVAARAKGKLSAFPNVTVIHADGPPGRPGSAPSIGLSPGRLRICSQRHGSSRPCPTA